MSLAAVGLIGCPSASVMGLARTLDQGQLQVFAAPGAIGTSDASGTPSVFASIEAGVRYGVTDMTEVGARLGVTGLALEGKFALVRNPTFDSGVDLSLAPSLKFLFASVGQGGSTTGGTIISVALPLLVGINIGNGDQLVLGPKIAHTVGIGGGTAIHVFWMGGSVGYAFKVLPGFRLLPEVAILAPVINAAAGGAGNGVGVSSTFYQAGVGLLFGGYDDR